MNMKSFLAIFLSGVACALAQFTVVHTFLLNNPGHGAYPGGAVVADGNGTLYGVTVGGGTNDAGVVYSVRTNGTAFTVLRQFEYEGFGYGGVETTPLLVGDTLYGYTPVGHYLFSIHTNGANFQLLHNFASSGFSHQPLGALIHDNGALFGITVFSELAEMYYPGAIFSINTNGTGYQVLHYFVDEDGNQPVGGLLQHDSKFYGMTQNGGAPTPGGSGVVYRVDMNGNNFQVLHRFDGQNGNGAYPYGRLVTDSTKLYGSTDSGGTNVLGSITGGIVFALDFDGSNFQVLHTFTNYLALGARPRGGVILNADQLLGTVAIGGETGAGGVFQVHTNGTGYQLLKALDYTIGEGFQPNFALIHLANTYYSTAFGAGTGQTSNDYTGVVFAITPTNGVANTICTLLPDVATNAVGTAHTVTSTVTSNGVAVAGALVNFTVTSGPNVGQIGVDTTDAQGHATFQYTGGATTGTDAISATGSGFACDATVEWIDSSLLTADLFVSKKASKAQVVQNKKLVYTIAVTNSGPDVATGIVVTDTLPLNVAVVAGSTTPGYTLAGRTLGFDLGALGAGQGTNLVVAIKPKVTGKIINKVNVAANEPDPNTTNNFAKAKATVVP